MSIPYTRKVDMPKETGGVPRGLVIRPSEGKDLTDGFPWEDYGATGRQLLLKGATKMDLQYALSPVTAVDQNSEDMMISEGKDVVEHALQHGGDVSLAIRSVANEIKDATVRARVHSALMCYAGLEMVQAEDTLDEVSEVPEEKQQRRSIGTIRQAIAAIQEAYRMKEGVALDEALNTAVNKLWLESEWDGWKSDVAFQKEFQAIMDEMQLALDGGADIRPYVGLLNGILDRNAKYNPDVFGAITAGIRQAEEAVAPMPVIGATGWILRGRPSGGAPYIKGEPREVQVIDYKNDKLLVEDDAGYTYVVEVEEFYGNKEAVPEWTSIPTDSGYSFRKVQRQSAAELDDVLAEVPMVESTGDLRCTAALDFPRLVQVRIRDDVSSSDVTEEFFNIYDAAGISWGYVRSAATDEYEVLESNTTTDKVAQPVIDFARDNGFLVDVIDKTDEYIFAVTNAEPAYDFGFTLPIEDLGNGWRLVAIWNERYEFQSARYQSGLHPTLTPEEWEANKDLLHQKIRGASKRQAADARLIVEDVAQQAMSALISATSIKDVAEQVSNHMDTIMEIWGKQGLIGNEAIAVKQIMQEGSNPDWIAISEGITDARWIGMAMRDLQRILDLNRQKHIHASKRQAAETYEQRMNRVFSWKPGDHPWYVDVVNGDVYDVMVREVESPGGIVWIEKDFGIVPGPKEEWTSVGAYFLANTEKEGWDIFWNYLKENEPERYQEYVERSGDPLEPKDFLEKAVEGAGVMSPTEYADKLLEKTQGDPNAALDLMLKHQEQSAVNPSFWELVQNKINESGSALEQIAARSVAFEEGQKVKTSVGLDFFGTELGFTPAGDTGVVVSLPNTGLVTVKFDDPAIGIQQVHPANIQPVFESAVDAALEPVFAAVLSPTEYADKLLEKTQGDPTAALDLMLKHKEQSTIYST